MSKCNDCIAKNICTNVVGDCDYVIGIAKNLYHQGAREFAEWLCGKYSRMEQGSIGFVKFQNIYWKSIEEVLAEWQKGAENDRAD